MASLTQKITSLKQQQQELKETYNEENIKLINANFTQNNFEVILGILKKHEQQINEMEDGLKKQGEKIDEQEEKIKKQEERIKQQAKKIKVFVEKCRCNYLDRKVNKTDKYNKRIKKQEERIKHQSKKIKVIVEKCRFCKENYHDHPVNKSTKYKKRYLQYLGFCSDECWNKLNVVGKCYTITYSDLWGDILKKDRIKINKEHLLST